MIHSRLTVVLLVLLTGTVASAQEPPVQNSVFWSEVPGTYWDGNDSDGMPMGNGLMGVRLFGAIDTERIALNESTFWAGVPHRYDNPDAHKSFPELKRLVAEGKYAQAWQLADREFIGGPVREMPYQPIGDWRLEFAYGSCVPAEGKRRVTRWKPGWDYVVPVSETPTADYRRKLDLETGVATIAYKVDGVEYRREAFVSYPDKVMVLRLSASRPGAINVRSSVVSPHPTSGAVKQQQTQYVQTIDGAWHGLPQVNQHLLKEGEEPPAVAEVDGLRFQTRIVATVKGGTVRIGDETIAKSEGAGTPHAAELTICGADEVVFLLTMATSFADYEDISADPAGRCAAVFEKLGPVDYAALKARHEADFSSLMGRVQLCVGDPARDAVATDRRIVQAKAGVRDTNLDALCFQFGRYLLVSSSRAGGQAANLQGIWNQDIQPAWESNYTVNINTQMNYWPAEVCNLSETHTPLFNLLEDLAESGARTARSLYGVGGWVTHHNTDLWRDTAVVDAARWGFWIGGGGWLATHLGEHFAFTQDKEFLRKYYPILRESARFYQEIMVEDKDGRLIIPASMSPEHPFVYKEGGQEKQGVIADSPVIDMAISREVFRQVIEASTILDTDPEFRAKLQETLDRMLPFQVNSQGVLQEWGPDFASPNSGHNYSPCYPVFPGTSIGEDTPELLNAFQAWNGPRHKGNGGWPSTWDMAVYARLGNRDAVGERLRWYVSNNLAPNLHYKGRNQSDGTFGFTAAVAETLLQSHRGEIHLLPALPPEWPDGRVSGLRARGGFTVDIDWKEGTLAKARITPDDGGDIVVRFGDKRIRRTAEAGVPVVVDATMF